MNEGMAVCKVYLAFRYTGMSTHLCNVPAPFPDTWSSWPPFQGGHRCGERGGRGAKGPCPGSHSESGGSPPHWTAPIVMPRHLQIHACPGDGESGRKGGVRTCSLPSFRLLSGRGDPICMPHLPNPIPVTDISNQPQYSYPCNPKSPKPFCSGSRRIPDGMTETHYL